MVCRFRFVFELVFLLTAVQAIGAEMETPAVQKWLENHPDETFQKLAPQWSSLTGSRPWKDVTGTYAINATYVSHDKTMAWVKVKTEDGREIKVPLEKLCKTDQTVVRQIAEIKGRITLAEEKARGSKTQADNQELGPREKQLAELDKKREGAMADQKKTSDRQKTELAKLTSKLTTLRKAKRPSATSEETANAFEKRQKDLKEAMRSSMTELQKMDADFEQERRHIVRQFSQPSDPQFTEYRGRLYTPQEMEKIKALEAEHGSPQIAANRYMQSLLTNGKINKAAFLSVSHNGCRVNYQVEYTSQAGFVMTRNGWVVMTSDANGFWYVHPFMLAAGGVEFDGPL